MSDFGQIGKNIKTIRKQSGLSLNDVYLSTGITKKSLSQIETGKSNPRRSTLDLIAKALGCSLSDLYGTTKPAPSANMQLHDAAEILSLIADLSPLMREVVLAILHKDPSRLEGIDAELAQCVQFLVKVD